MLKFDRNIQILLAQNLIKSYRSQTILNICWLTLECIPMRLKQNRHYFWLITKIHQHAKHNNIHRKTCGNNDELSIEASNKTLKTIISFLLTLTILAKRPFSYIKQHTQSVCLKSYKATKYCNFLLYSCFKTVLQRLCSVGYLFQNIFDVCE